MSDMQSEWQSHLVEILRWLEDALTLGEGVRGVIYMYSGTAKGLSLSMPLGESELNLYIDADSPRTATLVITPAEELDQGTFLDVKVYKPSAHHLATSLEYSCGEDELNYTVEIQNAQKLVFVADDPHATYSAKEHAQAGEIVAELLCAVVASLDTDEPYAALTQLLAESVKEIIEDEIATSFGN